MGAAVAVGEETSTKESIVCDYPVKKIAFPCGKIYTYISMVFLGVIYFKIKNDAE